MVQNNCGRVKRIRPDGGRTLSCDSCAAVIRGNVVENQMGKPLARPVVTPHPVQGTAGGAQAVRTDTYGAFAFSSLGVGAYVVRVSKAGFMPTEYGQKRWNLARTAKAARRRTGNHCKHSVASLWRNYGHDRGRKRRWPRAAPGGRRTAGPEFYKSSQEIFRRCCVEGVRTGPYGIEGRGSADTEPLSLDWRARVQHGS